MRALIYRQFGPAEVLEWTDGWTAPEVMPDGVLVRTVAGSVNPKDVLLRRGKFSRTLARTPLPRVSGMDAAGEVVAVGSGVREFSVGDRVFGMTNTFAGGVHAEIASFFPGEIWHAPLSLSLREAAAVPLAAQTALQALRDCCRIREGSRVLINGAGGGVGHFAVQIAGALGAEVHAVSGPDNLDFVQSLGAHQVHSYTDRPATAIDGAFDAVFDVFGKHTKASFSRQLGSRGIYVSTVPKIPTLWGEALAWTGISKRSRLVNVRSVQEDLKRIGNWIDQGLVRPCVQASYPAEAAQDAHRHVESRHTRGKVCILFGKEEGRE